MLELWLMWEYIAQDQVTACKVKGLQYKRERAFSCSTGLQQQQYQQTGMAPMNITSVTKAVNNRMMSIKKKTVYCRHLNKFEVPW